MPSSFSCGDVREKRDSHDGNLDACLFRPRPISVRKVGTSGTNGLGCGIFGAGLVLWSHRVWLAPRKLALRRNRKGDVDGDRPDFIVAVVRKP